MKIKKGFIYLHNIISSYTKSKDNFKPKILSYLVTNQCNSHCVTCNAWQKADLKYIDVALLESTLKKDLFSGIQHVGISGGEPSTFSDLYKHIEVILSTLPHLKTLSITSNCILCDFWVQNLCSIRDACERRGVYFQFNISLDGIGKIHDKIRGTKYNFDYTNRVIEFVRLNGINYQLHTTIEKYNVYHVNDILRFAKSINADIIFRLASRIYRLDNEKHLDRVSLNKKEISFICDFFQSNALLNYTKSPGRRLFYKHLANQLLSDGKRQAPCYFKHQGLVLASDGTISFCSRFANNFASIEDAEIESKYYDRSTFVNCSEGSCETCYHDQTGLWPLHEVLGEYAHKHILLLKKIWLVIYYLIRALSKQICNKPQQNINDIKNVCIVGMYGGEHVGDAAILGGVILRTIQRYPNINNITVFSFRKDRTECWVDNLTELPSNLTIKVCCDKTKFEEYITKSDLLIWAGGPVMELPVVLSRNYYFIKVAKSVGIPFEMEGIGYGPINTAFGKFITKRILNTASYISVRSDADAKRINGVINFSDNVFPDPAFTYLSTIPENTNLAVAEKNLIEQLLVDAKSNLIALNLRPLWSRYGTNSEFNYNKFLDEIAKAIELLNETTVVFFSMNADQFGFSDLDVAYSIRERLSSQCDFRIWEYEPTINGVITLLRKVDVAICMRFHAAIFALSQDVKTIGLDYSLSGKGKVDALFENRVDNCLSIINFKADELLTLLKN